MGLVRYLKVFASLLLVLICLGCGGGSGGSSGDAGGVDLGADVSGDGEDIDPEQSPETTAEAASSLRVTTYNVGLLPNFVPLSRERVGALQAALAEHQADVLCLQEVWRPEDAALLSTALQSSYSFVIVPEPRQKRSTQVPTCMPEDLQPIVQCAASACLFSNGGFLECLADRCLPAAEALVRSDRECAQALFAQGVRSINDLIEIREELFDERTPAGLFAFGGSSGLLIASKLPVTEVRLLDFFEQSTTSRRAALFVTVEKDGAAHRVACTHLTSNLDGLLPYAGAYSSWQEEGRVQAETMIAFAGRYAVGGREILAGDFNCSVPNPGLGVSGDFEDNCRAFLAAGYRDPAAEQLGCSFCGRNTLAQQGVAFEQQGDLLLDHVLLKGVPEAAQASLSFEQQVPVGGTVSNLSDHFGVTLQLLP